MAKQHTHKIHINTGSINGDLLDSTFEFPTDVDFSSDGKMILVAEFAGTTDGNKLRAIVVCENEVCPFGMWRGPCNAANRGACLNCTRAINSSYTAKADPFDQDKCAWQCNVGHYLVAPLVCSPCTNFKPNSSEYTTNGGEQNACQWGCVTGYRLENSTCVPIPPSVCVLSRYESASGPCAGGHFFAKTCADTEAAWKQDIATWGAKVDAEITDDECKTYVDQLCAIFGGNVTDNVKVAGYCPLCALRGYRVEQQLGTCASLSDCLSASRGKKVTSMLCCKEVMTIVQQGCKNYDTKKVRVCMCASCVGVTRN